MDETRKSLLDALQRMIEGIPVRVDKKRKISPTAVEEEAGVSKGNAYYSAYKDILAKIKSAKENQKSTKAKAPFTSNIKGSGGEVIELREEVASLKSKLAECERKLNLAEKYNAELTYLINEKELDLRLAVKKKIALHAIDNEK
ncbi:hypothetical protein XM69_c12011 [Vibrio parahaemolyticus]|uniref:hypothetical protein n=1 Tax=Vibrio parahaemolyticus TaxID=670 RepID=UPI0009B621C5|nr:hypothetical protein [Vibrio parahaemolyticus]OQK25772.1 hypothetical protein XM69_c12011 [Vibrio parahaemolyticus]